MSFDWTMELRSAADALSVINAKPRSCDWCGQSLPDGYTHWHDEGRLEVLTVEESQRRWQEYTERNRQWMKVLYAAHQEPGWEIPR